MTLNKITLGFGSMLALITSNFNVPLVIIKYVLAVEFCQVKGIGNSVRFAVCIANIPPMEILGGCYAL